MAELDFATALNMFSEGAQQAATTQAVNDAAAKSIHQQKVKIIAVSKTKTVEDIMGVY